MAVCGEAPPYTPQTLWAETSRSLRLARLESNLQARGGGLGASFISAAQLSLATAALRAISG